MQYDLKGNFVKEWKRSELNQSELKINLILHSCSDIFSTYMKSKWGYKYTQYVPKKILYKSKLKLDLLDEK